MAGVTSVAPEALCSGLYNHLNTYPAPARTITPKPRPHASQLPGQSSMAEPARRPIGLHRAVREEGAGGGHVVVPAQ